MNAADMNDMLRLAGQERRAGAEAPPLVLSRIEETLQSLPDRRGMQRLARRRRFGYVAASLVLIVLALTMAARLPWVADGLNRLSVVGAALRGEGKAMSVTDHGIKLTIEQVKYDGLILAVDYRIRSQHPIDWQTGTSSLVMRADGMEIISMRDANTFFPIGTGKLTKPNIYEGTLLVPMTSYRPPEFKLDISFTKLTGAFGAWSFKLPVKMDRTASTLDSNKRVYNSEGLLEIGDMTFTPLSTRFKFKYTFSSGQTSPSKYLAILQLVDDKDRILRMFAPISTSGGEAAEYPVYAQAVPKDARQLTIKVAYIDPNYWKNHDREIRTVMTEAPTKAHPLKLPQGEAGYIEISDVRYLADRTVIRYRTVGSNPGDQLNFGVLDEKGVYLPWMPQIEEMPGLAERTRTLGPLDPGAPLTFVTQPTVPFLYPGLETVVDIPR
ncbi:DUF4179 domain-containing protein [Cohnella sp. 56]|uniref:DUF4179 domain-containing protein n=1 Tax=Cohnella sp. 56 TaxID=3113722 RepID=UPI0030EA23FB